MGYLNLIFRILILVNIVLCISILIEKKDENSNLCFASNNGCSYVQESEYSHIFGISLAFLGLIFFSILFLLNIFISIKRDFLFLFPLFSFFGAIFAFYLIYIQFFKIKSICFKCIIIDSIAILLFLLSIFVFLKKDKKSFYKNELRC